MGIIPYPLFKVWSPGQRVGWVCFSRLVLDYIMVFLENLIPVGLSATQILEFHEILQIFVIYEDRKGVFGVQKILVPFLDVT